MKYIIIAEYAIGMVMSYICFRRDQKIGLIGAVLLATIWPVAYLGMFAGSK